jgi:plastocyanin
MRLLLVALALVAVSAPIAAQQEPEWRTAPEYDVLLRPFAFEPRTIRLRAGEPVALRFVNGGRATHSFHAPRFFRQARLRRGDEDLALTGRFRLAPGERRTIALVPARGRYSVSSYNFVQRLLGMRALIIVE